MFFFIALYLSINFENLFYIVLIFLIIGNLLKMISSILRKLATYLSFFFINKPSITKKNDADFKKIYPKIINYKLKKLNLKRTHIKFNLNFEIIKKKKNQKLFKRKFYSKNVFCS